MNRQGPQLANTAPRRRDNSAVKVHGLATSLPKETNDSTSAVQRSDSSSLRLPRETKLLKTFQLRVRPTDHRSRRFPRETPLAENRATAILRCKRIRLQQPT